LPRRVGFVPSLLTVKEEEEEKEETKQLMAINRRSRG
jgi:hypothetical protein